MEIIETTHRTSCPVCRTQGIVLYTNLEDKIFDIPGIWSMKKCPKNDCGVLWLDPTPKETELPKLYTHYYTHENQTPSIPFPSKKRRLRILLSHIRTSYLSGKYGYAPLSNSFLNSSLKCLAYLHPSWRDTQEADIFYLPFKKDGVLLDVGCGSGTTMSTLSERGWKTIGIDFDNNAVQNARHKNLDARHGDLFSQKFPDETFDTVVMGHVIEHVPNPIELFKECHRILKKGGVFVVTTPNASSPGSNYYGKNWRGLEVPRHLQIFTPNALVKIAKNAGYTTTKSFTTQQSNLYIWRASRDLKKYNHHNMTSTVKLPLRIGLHIINFVSGWLSLCFRNRGEVAVLFCKK